MFLILNDFISLLLGMKHLRFDGNPSYHELKLLNWTAFVATVFFFLASVAVDSAVSIFLEKFDKFDNLNKKTSRMQHFLHLYDPIPYVIFYFQKCFFEA